MKKGLWRRFRYYREKWPERPVTKAIDYAKNWYIGMFKITLQGKPSDENMKEAEDFLRNLVMEETIRKVKQ